MSDKVYWKQRDGRLISVDDMSLIHLRNTLKMIIKAHSWNNKPQPKPLSGIEANFEEDAINEMEDDHFDEDLWEQRHDLNNLP